MNDDCRMYALRNENQYFDISAAEIKPKSIQTLADLGGAHPARAPLRDPILSF